MFGNLIKKIGKRLGAHEEFILSIQIVRKSFVLIILIIIFGLNLFVQIKFSLENIEQF